jgi:hypothetical protein
MTNIILTIAMFVGFALLWGAWKLRLQQGLRQKMWLMIVAALVIFANIAIWTVPDQQGNSLAKAHSEWLT